MSALPDFKVTENGSVERPNVNKSITLIAATEKALALLPAMDDEHFRAGPSGKYWVPSNRSN